MTTPQLFPKPRKRLRQPSKRILRDELRRAADRIIEQAAQVEFMRNVINRCGMTADEFEQAAREMRRLGVDLTPGQIAELRALRRPWWRRIYWRKVG